LAQESADRALQLSAQGRIAEALHELEQALRLDASRADWWHQRGIACVGLRRFQAALESFERAAVLAPLEPVIVSARGVALEGLGRSREAAECYRRAIELSPAYVTAYANLGRLLREMGELDAALVHLQAALAQRPDFALAHNNLGCVLEDLGKLDEAIACYERAAALAPQQADFEYNLAIGLLKAGRYARGWRALESRLRTNIWRKIEPPAGLQRWDGTTPLAGRNLVLVSEQGFGDTIQFCRYGALLNARGIRPLLQAPATLAELLAGSGYFERVLEPHSALSPETHVWFPLMSLPLLFESLPVGTPAGPYLHPAPGRVARWRERIAGPAALRVGIGWQGARASELGSLRGRSMPLDCLAPLTALEGVQLITLQKGYGTEQLEACAFRGRIHDWTAELHTFADTAALVANLDLVITVDTALVHLAGAMGRTSWVMLHHLPGWPWYEGEHVTPWYPTLRIFRQKRAGDWQGVVGGVCAALGELMGAQRTGATAVAGS
jgi:tetratricopeptide (TPR) repeat protein